MIQIAKRYSGLFNTQVRDTRKYIHLMALFCLIVFVKDIQYRYSSSVCNVVFQKMIDALFEVLI